jgi:DNA-binding transcriptional MerR regulator
VRARTARRILRRQGMPPEEIRAVLAAEDPVVVYRLLELHRERLEEWIAEQRRLVTTIEGSVAGRRERRSVSLSA